MERNTEYNCTANEWVITESVCDLGTGFKLIAENAGTNAVFIDTVFIYYEGTKYLIDAFCMSDEHSSYAMASYSPDSCDSGYSAWDTVALDSNQMWTTKAVYFFDLEDSDISYDALVEDASDWCIVPDSCSCPTEAPTKSPTTSPTASPTTNPTGNPIAIPTIVPTADLPITSSPTVASPIPTPPTPIPPSSSPITLSPSSSVPTEDPTDDPSTALPTAYPSTPLVSNETVEESEVCLFGREFIISLDNTFGYTKAQIMQFVLEAFMETIGDSNTIWPECISAVSDIGDIDDVNQSSSRRLSDIMALNSDTEGDEVEEDGYEYEYEDLEDDAVGEFLDADSEGDAVGKANSTTKLVIQIIYNEDISELGTEVTDLETIFSENLEILANVTVHAVHVMEEVHLATGEPTGQPSSQPTEEPTTEATAGTTTSPFSEMTALTNHAISLVVAGACGVLVGLALACLCYGCRMCCKRRARVNLEDELPSQLRVEEKCAVGIKEEIVSCDA